MRYQKRNYSNIDMLFQRLEYQRGADTHYLTLSQGALQANENRRYQIECLKQWVLRM